MVSVCPERVYEFRMSVWEGSVFISVGAWLGLLLYGVELNSEDEG